MTTSIENSRRDLLREKLYICITLLDENKIVREKA